MRPALAKSLCNTALSHIFQNAKSFVRRLAQASTFILVYSLLAYDATKNQIEDNHNASEDSNKPENLIMTDINNIKHHAMKDHSWIQTTQPVG